MTENEVWSPRIGVRRTERESILLFLSQEEAAEKRELRNEIRMTRDGAEQHLKYLEENGFVDKTLVSTGMKSQYSLTEEGKRLAAEIRWGDDSQRKP